MTPGALPSPAADSLFRPPAAARDGARLQGRTVAVSGASGFIGRHLVRRLDAEGARVVVLRRPGTTAAPARHRSAPCDFDDPAALAATLRRLRASHVIHLGGYVSGDRSLGSVAVAMKSNVDNTLNLMLAAHEAEPTVRIVVAGTLEVTPLWRRSLKLGSPYGISKAMVEVLVGSLRQQFGIDGVCARIGMTYGPDDPNRQRLVPSVIRAFERHVPPEIGSSRRLCDWVYVDDIVEGLIRLAVLKQPPAAGVDLGTGVLHTVADVVERIRVLSGSTLHPTVRDTLERPNEQDHTCDVKATEAVLGWTPSTSLDEGLRRTIEWHRASERRCATPQYAG